MNAEAPLRPRWRRAAGAAAAVAVLALTATACGGTPAPAPSRATSGAAAADPPAAPAGQGAPAPAQPAASPAAAPDACSLNVIYGIAGESSSADAALMPSWTELQSNGWTALVPGSDWTMSASSAGGADIFSPDGESAANLGDHDSQTPWTLTTLAQVALSSIANVSVICTGQVERSNGLTTQAVELTGDYQNAPIHAVVVLSLLAPTTPDLFVGEIRSIYTPVSQWSTAAEQALWLIVKHAILVPQQ